MRALAGMLSALMMLSGFPHTAALSIARAEEPGKSKSLLDADPSAPAEATKPAPVPEPPKEPAPSKSLLETPAPDSGADSSRGSEESSDPDVAKSAKDKKPKSKAKAKKKAAEKKDESADDDSPKKKKAEKKSAKKKKKNAKTDKKASTAEDADAVAKKSAANPDAAPNPSPTPSAEVKAADSKNADQDDEDDAPAVAAPGADGSTALPPETGDEAPAPLPPPEPDQTAAVPRPTPSALADLLVGAPGLLDNPETIDLSESGNEPPLTFTWETVPEATAYELEVSLKPNFADPVVQTKTAKPPFRWPPKEAGRYLWRVRSVTKFGGHGAWSETGVKSLAVKPPYSKTNEVFAFPADRKPGTPFVIQLEWNGSARVDTYVVELAAEPTFSKSVKRYRVRKPMQRIALTRAGDFFWRVRPFGSNNLALGDFTPPYPLTITDKPELSSSQVQVSGAGGKVADEDAPPDPSLLGPPPSRASGPAVPDNSPLLQSSILSSPLTATMATPKIARPVAPAPKPTAPNSSGAKTLPGGRTPFPNAPRAANLAGSPAPVAGAPKAPGTAPANSPTSARKKPATTPAKRPLDARTRALRARQARARFRPFHFTVGVGITALDYAQSGAPAVSEKIVTPKISAVYNLSPGGWSIGANAFANAAVISSSDKSNTVQLLGANLRIGPPPLDPTAPVRLCSLRWFLLHDRTQEYAPRI